MTPCTDACFARHLCPLLGYHLRGESQRKRYEANPAFFRQRATRLRTAKKRQEPQPRSRFRRDDCLHLGETHHRMGCNCKVSKCALHGLCTFGRTLDGHQDCLTCKDYASSRRKAMPEPPPLRPGDPACGVVVGCYRWPGLAELQIRSIRQTCGPVPILLSDDCSSGKLDEFERLTRLYQDVDYQRGQERIGHAGGDLQAFRRGLQWAAARKLDVLAKLSHRMVLVRPYWLQDGAKEMLDAGHYLASQPCVEGRWTLPVRSEIVLLAVPWWRDKIGQMTPGPIRMATEGVIWELAGHKMHLWSLFGPERVVPNPAFLWHMSSSVQQYRELAERLGVPLDDDFTTAPWQVLGAFRLG